MIEYQYQAVTHKDLINAIKWCQNKLCLRDWQIELDTGYKRPTRFKESDPEKINGATDIKTYGLFAAMWVPIERLAAENINATIVTIHEMVHVFYDERIRTEVDEDQEEQVVNILSEILYKAYCGEKGIEIAPENPCEF